MSNLKLEDILNDYISDWNEVINLSLVNQRKALLSITQYTESMIKELILDLVGEDEELETTNTRRTKHFKEQQQRNNASNVRNHFRYELRRKVAEL
jgi:hypothetical protein